jgi:predicted RNase H-like HicB family nuclease
MMLDLPYSLVIEATEEPDFFGFYSPDLKGFTGVGHSVEDCLYQAKWGMKEFLQLMAERNMEVPPQSEEPTVTIKNAKPQKAGGSIAKTPTLKRTLKSKS